MKRQGDLLIMKVATIPITARKQESRVLAEGEATGHLHKLDGGEVYMENDTLYFKVDRKTVTLTHPEHKLLTFESGYYKVIRQREYEPKNLRYVND